MIASASFPLHRMLVEQLRDQEPVGLEALCAPIARRADIPIQQVYPALAQLMELDIVQFHPMAVVQGDTEPQAIVTMDHIGYDLYTCLTETSISARTQGCAVSMLLIINSCGMATKSQLFARLRFVKGARRYSYMQLSIQLRALVHTGKLMLQRDDDGITLFAITPEGRRKASRHLKQLGYTGNISMGE